MVLLEGRTEQREERREDEMRESERFKKKSQVKPSHTETIAKETHKATDCVPHTVKEYLVTKHLILTVRYFKVECTTITVLN